MTQMVELVIDEQAMRRTLRFAFANHDTAVQELIQNARRAGATQVEVAYDADAQKLTVKDDGAGVADFAILMRAGVSGWGADTVAAEKPYGLGFLSAIYGAAHVSVSSRGKCLAFDTERAIDSGRFEVVDAPFTEGTTIVLVGFVWKRAAEAIQRMATGYALPITFNGVVQKRPQALDASWNTTSVGHIKLVDGVFVGPKKARVYLQGFMVKDPERFNGAGAIVHLDATRFLGKLPDRNVVIDEEDMVAAVDVEIRRLYAEKLEAFRRALTPIEFCIQGYDLARSLGRLNVFNAIDVAPGHWLQCMAEMPYDTYEWEHYLGELAEGRLITRQDVESGSVRISDLEAYSASDEAGQLILHFAWMEGHLLLAKNLHAEHWLYCNMEVDSQTPAQLRVIGAGKRDKIPDRTSDIWGDIQLCEAVEIEANGRTVRIEEPLGTQIDGPVIYVPVRGGTPVYPTAETLKQLCSFSNEERADEDALNDDVDTVRAKVRDMVTDSAEARVAMAIQDALRNNRELRGLDLQLTISSVGEVTVTNLVTHEPEPQGPPTLTVV